MRRKRLVPTIVIDVDDTVVYCKVLYNAMRSVVARELEPEHPERAEAFLLATDHLFRSLTTAPIVEGSFGRFVGGAYVAYRLMRGDTVDQADLTRVQDAVNLVYRMQYPAVPDAVEALHVLRTAGYQLVAYTKGPEGLQRRKLVEAGLLHLFDRVVCTPVPKTAESFRALLNQVCADPARSFSIGDNYEEDICTAIDAGIDGVQVGLEAADGHVTSIVDAVQRITAVRMAMETKRG